MKTTLHHLKVPLIKEQYNLVFADCCHNGMDSINLLEEFTESFHDGDKQEAKLDLTTSNAMVVVFRQKNILVMILPRGVKPGVIAHECFHLTKAILEKKDMTLSDATEEVYAHTLDFLVEQVTKLKEKL